MFCYLDEVDTLDEVDMDDDVDTELEVDTLTEKITSSTLQCKEFKSVLYYFNLLKSDSLRQANTIY